MSLIAQQTLRVAFYESPGSPPVPAAERLAVFTALLDQGYTVTRLTAERPVAGMDSRPTLVLGRFHGVMPSPPADAPDAARLQFCDVTGLDPAGVVAAVERVRATLGAAVPGAWKPWFPVIDFDRCTQCMQCLSFCLFDVYGVNAEQKIEVRQSENCKTNCPACSRVCPEAAIIFPKYKAGPINGAAVQAADLQREKMKVDISALLGGDIYALLRQRSERARSRFSKERDPDKALDERRKCLAQLAQLGDVPPEVLMALPSPEEIQRRAQEAAAKARAALETKG